MIADNREKGRKGQSEAMAVLSSCRLGCLPVSIKAVVSLTLAVLGMGYLTAMVNLYLTYHMTDGKAGLTVADLQRTFYGSRDNTKLAAKIHGGSMEQFLPAVGDREKVLSWIQDGAGREGFEKVVQPILAGNCVRCHNPDGLQRFAPLTSFEEVMVVTQIDRGEPVALWARVAHTHLQAIGMIFLVLGIVFSFTSWPAKVKTAVVVLPFLALMVDFAARFLARYYPVTVYAMLASGMVIGLAFGTMILVPLYEMWLKRPAELTEETL